MFIGKTDVEAETPILWPSDAKSWPIWKDPYAGKDWRWEEKGMTEDEMVWCHHRLNEYEFESTLGVGDGQEGLACCGSRGHKESDTTEWLNWTEWMYIRMTDSTVLLLKLISVWVSRDRWGKWDLWSGIWMDINEPLGLELPKTPVRASQVVLVVKNLPANAGDKTCRVDPWVGKILWRRAWQSTPVFLPGESHGQRESGGLQSKGSKRVVHDQSDLVCTYTSL